MLKHKPQFVIVPLVIVAALAGGCAGSLDRAQEALTVGDEAEAEVQLRRAISSSSSRAEASRLLSILLAEQGNTMAASDSEAAEDHFREALELDNYNEDARLGLARLLMKRGFMADARELLEAEGCRGCGRLAATIMHEEAVRSFGAGEMVTARASFEAAFEVGGDPLDALGMAQTHLGVEPAELEEAQTWLGTAAPLIVHGQAQAEQIFRGLRVELLIAAASTGHREIVESALDLRTTELEDEPEFDLRFRLSQEQFRNGDSDPAIQRLSALIEKSGQYLEPTQREVMGGALEVMYSARAAAYLRTDDPVGAARDIGAGLKLDPNNNRLKLQQVLAIAANRLPLAFTQVEKARAGKDRDQVTGILWSLQAIQEVENGKLAKAADAIEKAELSAPLLPELALAKAYMLASLRNEDLKRSELQDARKLSGFEYPGGRINQYPSALAHLARATELIDKQGPLHAWRGAGFDRRLAALTTKLAFFPYKVGWWAGKGGMIEIVAEGGQKSVDFSGPRWLKGTAIASPGNSAEIPVPNIGLVMLVIDGKDVGLVVEANTRMIIEL